MPYEIEHTDQFERWFLALEDSDRERVVAAVDELEARGPGLGRPRVDTLSGSRHQNMKELRVGTIRVLFCFDPRRTAILLIAADKRDRWQAFYAEMLPRADDLYDEHIQTLRDEGVIT